MLTNQSPWISFRAGAAPPYPLAVAGVRPPAAVHAMSDGSCSLSVQIGRLSRADLGPNRSQTSRLGATLPPAPTAPVLTRWSGHVTGEGGAPVTGAEGGEVTGGRGWGQIGSNVGDGWRVGRQRL